LEKNLTELTPQELEEICLLMEEAARKYVLSQVPSKYIESLNITVEANMEDGLNLAVDVELSLSPTLHDVNVQKVADEAAGYAFNEIEKYLRGGK